MAVSHAPVHGHGALLGVDGQKFICRLHGEELVSAVSDLVEAMARAEDL